MMKEANPATALERAHVVQDFARSELFERTFQEGMELVEETAGYLDGAGRQASKLLSRHAALAYASESMRLTTRLMQLASWLLVQRAVREGDMQAEAACEDRYRLAEEPARSETQTKDAAEADLPADLRHLLDRSERLFERARRLDRSMYIDVARAATDHPVLSQMDRLRSAFGG